MVVFFDGGEEGVEVGVSIVVGGASFSFASGGRPSACVATSPRPLWAWVRRVGWVAGNGRQGP